MQTENAVSARRTQADRRRDTREKLLEATIDCLSRLGHARTTTTEIVATAGVSQGALFKHYPSKGALLGAAVEHLFAHLRAHFRRDLAALQVDRAPGADTDFDATFDLLWSVFAGPRLIAAFELFMAARTDSALATHLHPVVQAHRLELVANARELFPEAASQPGFDGFLDLLMCSMEGILIEQFGTGAKDDAALACLKTLAASFLQPSDGAR